MNGDMDQQLLLQLSYFNWVFDYDIKYIIKYGLDTDVLQHRFIVPPDGARHEGRGSKLAHTQRGSVVLSL